MIPFPTTRVQLLSAGENDTPAEDWGGTPDVEEGYSSVGSPVRAHFSVPLGANYISQAGSSSEVTFRLICDPCEIEPGMRVRDLASGAEYDVNWCMSRPGPIEHVVAGVSYSTSTP